MKITMNVISSIKKEEWRVLIFSAIIIYLSFQPALIGDVGGIIQTVFSSHILPVLWDKPFSDFYVVDYFIKEISGVAALITAYLIFRQLKVTQFQLVELRKEIHITSKQLELAEEQQTHSHIQDLLNHHKTELLTVDREIDKIISTRYKKGEILQRLKNIAVLPPLKPNTKFQSAGNFFSTIGNDFLTLPEIIPHLSRFGISTRDKIYHVPTEALSLHIQKFMITLVEIEKLTKDEYFTRYYATKYFPLLIDLNKFTPQIDPRLIRCMYLMANKPMHRDLSLNKIDVMAQDQATQYLERNYNIKF